MARYWAGGAPQGETLALFGMEAADVDDDIEVWPENLETVEAFFACRTQWRFDAMNGTPLGLRYADVAATLDLLAVGDRRDVFDGIRTMEAAALDVLNAKRNG